MKKLTLAALALMAIVAVAPAQSSTMHSGPWMMRKSTGDATVDRTWFIADRTLNAAEAETFRTMIRSAGGNTGYTLQKAIINAIDANAKGNMAGYNTSYSGDWMGYRGMSDGDIYASLDAGLSWSERGVLHNWAAQATPSQMAVVAKLVRNGGWANSQWSTSGMGS